MFKIAVLVSAAGVLAVPSAAHAGACSAGEVLVELTVASDGFASESSGTITDADTGVVVASFGDPPGGVTSSHLPYEVFDISACVPNDHSVVVDAYDAFGDGICCAFGVGYLSVRYNDETVYDGDGFLGGFGDTYVDYVEVSGVAGMSTRVAIAPRPPAELVVDHGAWLWMDEMHAPGEWLQLWGTVSNPNPFPVTLVGADDSVLGDITEYPWGANGSCDLPAGGVVLDPGSTFTCDYFGYYVGAAGDTVSSVLTVSGADADGGVVVGTHTYEMYVLP